MLIQPAEAHGESANNIQTTVRLDNGLESQGTIDQTRPLNTGLMRSHEIKIDKNHRLLNSDESHAGLIVTALVASTIFALFAISALPWPFASTSGKRSSSSLNLDSSPPLVSKKEDRLPIHGTIIQKDGRSSAQLPQNSNISPSSANDHAKPSASASPTTSLVAKDPQTRVKLTATPETRPTTIEGWTLREVANGTAVLEGPDGIRTVARGDMIPGVGRVESIFRWGSRPIVATSRGLISTP
jgi:hypothetical protein